VPVLHDPPPDALRGRRVLLVEDEPMVALLVEDLLLGAGAAVLGPAYTVDAALGLIEAVGFGAGLDAAVLDIDLRGAAVWPVADLLASRGVPFLLVTGCGRSLGRDAHGAAPVLAKPFSPGTLVAAVRGLAPAAAERAAPG
jgi:CheY-like chemotaxis protein